MSTFIWRIASMEARAIDVTATRIVTGRLNAINTSHIPSSLTYFPTSSLPAKTVPDRLEQPPKTAAHARLAIVPVRLQFPLAPTAFERRQRLPRWPVPPGSVLLPARRWFWRPPAESACFRRRGELRPLPPELSPVAPSHSEPPDRSAPTPTWQAASRFPCDCGSRRSQRAGTSQ